MSYQVNTINCQSDWANTGFGDCSIHMLIEGLIQVPKDASFTKEQLAAIVSHITTKTREANPLNRFYPWPAFIGGEPTGGDPNKVDFDNGSSITTWENDYLFTGRFYEGGFPVNNALRTRNGQDLYFLAYGRGHLFGAVENGVYKGFAGKNFWAASQMPGAFKVESKYSFSFNVTTRDWNENLWYVKAPGIETVKGLKTLELEATASPVVSATGLVKASLKLKGYGTDYVALNGTAIIALSGWAAKNKATGEAITITTKTVVAGQLEFDLDHQDTHYPTSGGSIEITPPAIADLAGAGTLNAEILPLTITVP